MRIDKIKNAISENRYSKEYLLCALCTLAFQEKLTYEAVSKEGENYYVKEDRTEDIYYWWFAGIKDILSLSIHENVIKYEFNLDIDRYCSMLVNAEDFLSVCAQSRQDRNSMTSVTDDKDYYMFSESKFLECYEQNKDLLNQKVMTVKKIYLKLMKKNDIWSSMLDTYPAKRIIGYNIASRRKDINSDEFDYILGKCVDFLKKDTVSVKENDTYSFLTLLSAVLNTDKFRRKNTSNLQVLDIVNSRVSEDTFVDRSTGKIQTVDSLSSINSDLEEFHRDKSQVLESFTLPDLNKSLAKISDFNNHMRSILGSSINMISLLDSEPSCSDLLDKLNKFTKRIYGNTCLTVVESRVYGTEQTTSNSLEVKGLVTGLYNNFRSVSNENVLYVSHLIDKLSDSKAQSNNKASGFIPYYTQFNNSTACGQYPKIFEDIREIVTNFLSGSHKNAEGEAIGAYNPRCNYFSDSFYIYVYDRTASYYDRSGLPAFICDRSSELYLPVPYEKDPSHNSLSSVKTVAESISAFSDLKTYSEKTGKPLSDMYYYAKGAKNVHEKTGGLLNMQNGDNEFADIETVYDTNEVLRKVYTGRFMLQSLVLAEKMTEDKVTLDTLIDKISKVKEIEADELSSCSDGQRRNMLKYINNARIKEDDLITITDIFCENLTRLSAFMQGLSWRTGSAFIHDDYDSIVSKTDSGSIIENGLIRSEYLEGVFMRYNGDNYAGLSRQNTLTSYLNFCNMEQLQNSTSNSSPCSELARLSNFEYMKTDDFLGVSSIMLKFVLPSIIDIPNGQRLESLVLGSEYKSKDYIIIMDDYVRMGAKLAWIAFNSKNQGSSYSLIDTINCKFDFIFRKYEDSVSELVIDGLKMSDLRNFERCACKRILVKQKQLALLLVKSCMYATDLVDLCKSLRDFVCAMLGVSNKAIINSPNDELNKITESLSFKEEPLFTGIKLLFENQLYSVFLNLDNTLENICQLLPEDLASILRTSKSQNLNVLDVVNSLDEKDRQLVKSGFDVVFKNSFGGTSYFAQKKEILKSCNVNTADLDDFIFSNIVISEISEVILDNFEERGATSDLYRELNNVNSDITDVSIGEDSDISRFIACEYIVNVFNKVYSFMHDIAHDCYRMSTITAVSNDTDYQRLTLDRCCFYLSYRKSFMQKLFNTYSTIKQEASATKGVFDYEDLEKLHKAVLLPHSTLPSEVCNPNDVINYFCYVVNKTKNGIPGFKSYIDRVFGSNEQRLRRIAYPNFNLKAESKFNLTSDIVSKLNKLANGSVYSEKNNAISCIGKFSGSAIELLKCSVKDSGLYRSVTFKDGIAVTSTGEPLVMYSVPTGNSNVMEEPDMYVLHETGLFFQISIDGKIKPLDTVTSVMLTSGSEYLNSSMLGNAKYDRLTQSELFNSVNSNGVGISSAQTQNHEIKKVLADTLVEFSEALIKANELDLLGSNGDVVFEETNNTSLSISANQTTELTVSSRKSDLRQSKNRFKSAFELVISDTSEIKELVSDILNKEEVMSQDQALGVVDSVISNNPNTQLAIERYMEKGLEKKVATEAAIEDFISEKKMIISEALDLKVDANRVIDDIDLMYSSIVPNTVR